MARLQDDDGGRVIGSNDITELFKHQYGAIQVDGEDGFRECLLGGRRLRDPHRPTPQPQSCILFSQVSQQNLFTHADTPCDCLAPSARPNNDDHFVCDVIYNAPLHTQDGWSTCHGTHRRRHAAAGVYRCTL